MSSVRLDLLSWSNNVRVNAATMAGGPDTRALHGAEDRVRNARGSLLPPTLRLMRRRGPYFGPGF